MSETWDPYSSEREYMVAVELYVSSIASSALRKPATIRKRPEKRESSAALLDESKLRDKSSYQALPKGLSGSGHWRPATCKLAEEEDRVFLNIYLDETILYQTVYIHLINQTDIRPIDSSLFFRKDCVALYCIEGQRWTSANTAEPIYLQFNDFETRSLWIALLKSYAIPENYGRWFFPTDGGSYRMWRQIELQVMQGRHIRTQRLTGNGYDAGENIAESDFDGELSCEIHLNNILCGRTTGKQRAPNNVMVDWHERFIFPDLPPFETLDIKVWKEKKSSKPYPLGLVQIQLHHFRRGEATEGWFPIIHGVGGPARETQIGEIRLSIRVEEEIIPPAVAYEGLEQAFLSRNFLAWMGDVESKLRLKHLSTHMMSVAVARNRLIPDLEDFAEREVRAAPLSQHQTLFRGNTVFSKAVEATMGWYGKAFLEASIGSVLRKLCAEKVAIEVDPIKSAKGARDIEKNVDQLVYWCQEFWTQIYSVREECPKELKRLFYSIRRKVEDKCHRDSDSSDLRRDLPKQAVSAFIFLRFIVPAILHPHLFGLYPGLPPDSVKRSLTLIAKVIQSLANLNPSSQKESFMVGVKDFVTNNIEGMVDYIASVSTPVDDSRPPAAGVRTRQRIIRDLKDRHSQMTPLDRESTPSFPHLLDVPRHLAVISSAVIRSCRDPSLQPIIAGLKDHPLWNLCVKCNEVEERALVRVTQLAAKLSIRRPSLPDVNAPDASLPARAQIPRKKSYEARSSKLSRPSTAPSSGSNSSRRYNEVPSTSSRNATRTDAVGGESKRERPSTRQHNKGPSVGNSSPVYVPPATATGASPLRRPATSSDNLDETKKKRGLFRGILKR